MVEAGFTGWSALTNCAMPWPSSGITASEKASVGILAAASEALTRDGRLPRSLWASSSPLANRPARGIRQYRDSFFRRSIERDSQGKAGGGLCGEHPFPGLQPVGDRIA